MTARLARAGALSVVLLLTVVAYHDILQLGHLGWDTWPMIASARSGWAAISERLMGDYYPIGSFYRPLASLTFTLNQLLGGTGAWSFHLADLLILLGSTSLVFAVARRLQFGTFASAVAAAVFALHPLQLEVLPVSARRADALSVFFVLATLAMIPRRTARSDWASGTFSFAAAASKELGVLVVPLVFLHQLFVGRHDPLRDGNRWRAAARDSLPGTLGVSLFVVLRTSVLGGLGGHPDSSLTGAVTRLPEIFRLYPPLLSTPQPLAADPGRASSLALTVGVLALVGALTALLFTRRNGSHATPPWRTLAFLLAWFFVAAALTGLSGELQAWYCAPFLPPFVLAVAWLVERGYELSRERRPAALLPALGALALAGSVLRYNALVHDYVLWEQADADVEALLVRVRERTVDTELGQLVRVRGALPVYRAPREEVGIRHAATIAYYGVQAFCDVELAERELDVRDARDPGAVARPGRRVVVIRVPVIGPPGSGARFVPASENEQRGG